MKLLVMVALLFCCCNLWADWKLAAIYTDQQSDLKLDGAYRLKGKKKVSTFVDKRIKSAQLKPVIMVDYMVPVDTRSQGFLCISLHDLKNLSFSLCFDSKATHSIEWKRMKSQELAPNASNEGCSIEDGNFCAQAYLKSADGTVIAQAKHSYNVEQKGIEFDVTIYGKAGSYQLELTPTV